MKRLLAWLSDLRVAIVLLLLIALASAVGTAIPQGDPAASYLEAYGDTPWLGLLHGEQVLQLQLDQVYSSGWFLGLLAWLGLALILCSWRRQWPALQAARRWIDYRTPRQLSKLAVGETIACPDAQAGLTQLSAVLQRQGWQLKPRPGRLAARWTSARHRTPPDLNGSSQHGIKRRAAALDAVLLLFIQGSQDIGMPKQITAINH